MSTAPLNRDEQIELMKNASDRMDSFVQKWKNEETVSEMLCEPHAELTDGETYSRSNEKLACFG